MSSPVASTAAREHERGAVVVLAAFSFVLIATMAAIAIDLGSVRHDRSDNQVAVDTAVTAAVVGLTENGGVQACEDALDYVSSAMAQTLIGTDCTGFSTLCDAATTSASTTGTSGLLTVTITHPVDDLDPLMNPGAIGAPSLGITAGDGERCDRVGVSMTEIHETFFGGIVGVDTLTSTVHAVARDGTDRTANRTANLVVLERHDCDALSASNGAGLGGIQVGAITDATGQVFPGRIAVDSDGTGSRCGSRGTIDINGTNGLIRADGPGGCATEVGVAGSGQGCGVIETFASGPPGCLMPACRSTGSIYPNPNQSSRRITRASMDHRWNCKATYPAAYDIDGCFEAGALPPYIDQLIAAVGPSGTPSGFSSYTGAGHPCNISPSDNETIPRGNWLVDCQLQINGNLTFAGGNVVFDDAVTIRSSGSLIINDANPSLYNWVDQTNLIHTESSADAAYAYFRSGDLSKAGQGSIIMRSTLVYLAPGTAIDVTGGSGTMDWTPPQEGPFKELTLWSDSVEENSFSGQGNLTMEGLFFTPLATLSYTGNGSQQQVGAQYIVNKLHVSGQGGLYLAPTAGAGVAFPNPQPTVLIR